MGTEPQTGILQSMTGSGRATVQEGPYRVEVDVRSVNNRFLKTSVRTSGSLRRVDTDVSARVKSRLRRGHVSVSIRLEHDAGSEDDVRIDQDVFVQAADELIELAKRTGLSSVSARDVLATPGVIVERAAGPNEEVVARLAGRALDEALDALIESRKTEGAHLAAELKTLLDDVDVLCSEIAEHADELPGLAQRKLHERIAALLKDSGAQIDPAQLAREVAVLADRADIREELTRLHAHGIHARDLLRGGGDVGRALEFLVQEIHREANTIGSKATDLNVTKRVLGLKSAIERIREQVQNVE